MPMLLAAVGALLTAVTLPLVLELVAVTLCSCSCPRSGARPGPCAASHGCHSRTQRGRHHPGLRRESARLRQGHRQDARGRP